METSIYVSTPWRISRSKKSDPLGFQNIANEIAQQMVPGITRSQQDCRWLTLLCKGLSKIQHDPNNYEKFSNYERSIINFAINENETKGRHLPGKKSSKVNWPKRYRYYGPYGSYRALLMELNLTERDGWTLTKDGKMLANTLDFSFDFKLRVKTCFENFRIRYLPTVQGTTSITKKIEIQILDRLLFGETDNGKVRLKTLKKMEKTVESFWQGFEHCKLFDQFTKICFEFFIEILGCLKEKGCKEIPKPENRQKIIQLSLKVIDNKDMWREVKDIAEKIVNSDCDPGILIRHHLKTSLHSSRWVGKINDKYVCMDAKRYPRNYYTYRLWNLWHLGYQVGRIKTAYPFDQIDDEGGKNE